MLLAVLALRPALNAPVAFCPARTVRLAQPVMQWAQPDRFNREPLQPPGWDHNFKQAQRGTPYRQGRAGPQARVRPGTTEEPLVYKRRSVDRNPSDRFTGGVTPTRPGFGTPPGFGGAPPPGFGAPSMTEAEVARLKQEVEEAEAVLDRLLQEMRAEEATFKADSAAADVTTDRYQEMLNAHTQQWQTHKQEYDEAHRVVTGKKREAELAAQLLAAEQSTRAKQAKAEETEEQLRAAQQERMEAEREEQMLREQQSRSRSPQQQRGFPQGARPPPQGYGQPQGMPYHATSQAEYHRLRRQGMVAPPGGFPQQGGFPQPGGFPYPGRYRQQGYGGPYLGGYERGPRAGYPGYGYPGYGYPGGFPGDLPDGRPGRYQRYSEGGFGTSREYGGALGQGSMRGGHGDRPDCR